MVFGQTNISTFNILSQFGNQNKNNGKNQKQNQVLACVLCPLASRMDLRI